VSQLEPPQIQARLEPRTVHAPELGPAWINSHPLSMHQLRGRAVLIDFWDYTCVNCIRTLPYLIEWHRRYKDKGLQIIGVHSPEFYFAQVGELVQMAVRDFGIEYPVVLDNDYSIWQAYANRYWPSKYLIDQEGYLRYATFGEGAYGETESAIQAVLREANPDVELPPLLAPLRPMDVPGAMAFCARPTPELYLGHKRGKLANAEGFAEDEVHEYAYGAAPQEDLVELSGKWESRPDCIDVRGEPSRLRVAYRAAEVNLVMAASVDAPVARLDITENGRPLVPDARGRDVLVDEEGRTYLRIDIPRMYSLVSHSRFTEATLELESSSPGLQMFAFTFVSCL
jgi:thiol-disulfide isomerase/thioredoxin